MAFVRGLVPFILRGTQRLFAVVRWLFSTESLPETAAGVRKPTPRMVGLARSLAGRDRPAGAAWSQPEAVRRRRFLSWLLSPGACPRVPISLGRHHEGFFRWVLSLEKAPEQPRPSSRRGGGCLRRVLSREQCPTAPMGFSLRGRALRHRERFSRWLLSVEKPPEHRRPPPNKGEGVVRRVLSRERCPIDRTKVLPRRRGFMSWLLAGEEL